jgi:hypothetical protein
MRVPETPLVDINLDELEATARAEKVASAPVVIQERNREMAPAERLASEMSRQKEYISKRAIFQHLQAEIQKMSLPNLDRVSAELPPEAMSLIGEAVDGLQMLSFYSILDRGQLVKELESMIKGHHLDGEVRRLNDLILQSEASVAKLKEAVAIQQASARAATNDFVKAQQLVDAFRKGGESNGQMKAMPEIPKIPEKRSLLDRVRGIL